MTIERYLFLDANLLAGYYAPQTLTCEEAESTRGRIATIVESVRKGCSPHLRLLTPEICVAEAQTVLSKHANAKWKGAAPKRKDGRSIHAKSYSRIRDQMAEDLHSGQLIESIPQQRYHILAKHLIAAVDHHTHVRPRRKNNQTRDLGGTDQLICGMAIWLHRFLGPDRLMVLTADYRMAKVLNKARGLRPDQLEDWGINEAATRAFGFKVGPDAFPEALHLPTASERQLRDTLGSWPLPTRRTRKSATIRPPTKAQIETLVSLYRNMGVNRDHFPYTKLMEQLTRQFNDASGHNFSEAELWPILVSRLKQGGGSTRKAGSAASVKRTAR